MDHRTGAARILVAAALGVAVLAPGAAAAPPPPVVFGLTPQAQVEPTRVFLQADAGPYLRDLRWTGWGSPTATGTGTWELDCSAGGPSCGASTAITRHPGTYVLSDLAPCPRFGPDGRSYRRGRVTIDLQDGTSRTVALPSTYGFCAKRPTGAAARAAVRRFAQRRLHASGVNVRCHPSSGIDLDCVARWTTSTGRRTQRGFNVSGRLHSAPRVTPYGAEPRRRRTAH
jgi:hypothetical protein